MTFTFFLVKLFSGLPGFERRFIQYAPDRETAIFFVRKRVEEEAGITRRGNYTAEPLSVVIESGTFPTSFEVTQQTAESQGPMQQQRRA
jgi:hypothetical protein